MIRRKKKILNVKCEICGKAFYAKPNLFKHGWGKYCSRKCQHSSQLKGKFVYCDICGKKIWRSPKQVARSKSGKFLCNKSHETLWRNRVYSGPRHPLWTGGIRAYRDQYKKIFQKNRAPVICTHYGYNKEKVLVVHHKDGDRRNNRSGNLEWLCRNCHYLIHNGETV